MKYDLIVESFKTERAKLIAARSMAANPSIPLQKALFIIEKVPFTLFKNLEPKDAQSRAKKFSELGLVIKFSESEKTPVSAINIDTNLEYATSLPDAEITNRNEVQHANIELNSAASSSHQEPISKETPPYKTPRPQKAETGQKQFKHSVSIRPAEPNASKQRKLILPSGLIALLIIVLLITWLYNSSEQRSFGISKKPLLARSSTTSKKGASTTQKQKGVLAQAKPTARSEVSPIAQNSSNVFLDSARFYTLDQIKAINFYKIAISFNQYNLNAWYGLLDAYRVANLTEEFLSTQEKMKQIFDQSIFSTASIIEPYGVISDIHTTVDGILRIEYKTIATSKSKLINETFLISRAIRSVCNCDKISLFASTRKGAGLIVHLNSNKTINSISDFLSAAQIHYLD